jgi:hypothetical protein
VYVQFLLPRLLLSWFSLSLQTIFSMGFFNYDFEGANGRIRISQDGWIFLAVALPMTIITLALSWAWMRFTLGTEGMRLQKVESQSVKDEGGTM